MPRNKQLATAMDNGELRAPNKKAVLAKLNKKNNPGGVLDGKPSASAKNAGTGKKPRRYRPGTVSLREIRKFQKTGSLLSCKAPFLRLIKDITAELSSKFNPSAVNGIRYNHNAVMALQELAETYMTDLYGRSVRVAVHAKRVTMSQADMRLVKALMSDTLNRDNIVE